MAEAAPVMAARSASAEGNAFTGIRMAFSLGWSRGRKGRPHRRTIATHGCAGKRGKGDGPAYWQTTRTRPPSLTFLQERLPDPDVTTGGWAFLLDAVFFAGGEGKFWATTAGWGSGA